MSVYTADRLLKGVKRRLTMPANQSLLSDEDLLELADDVASIDISPDVIAVRQDFMVRRIRIPLVGNQASYALPSRAMGQTLRDLKLVLPSTTDGVSSYTRDLKLIQIEDEHLFREGSTPDSFYISGDQIILLPTPATDYENYELEIWFEMQISELVKLENVSVVQNISGDDVTMVSVPDTLAIGCKADFVRGIQGHNVIDYDKVITNINGNVISWAAGDVPNTVTPTITSVLAVGDYVCLAGTAPVIPLPKICSRYLETLTALRAADATDDDDAYKRLEKTAKMEKKQMQKLLAPRIRGEPTKIINRNGLLNRGGFGRRTTGAGSIIV